ncbi:MAG: hypothetical protein R3F61_15610 [Myxococcota bacterium]
MSALGTALRVAGFRLSMESWWLSVVVGTLPVVGPALFLLQQEMWFDALRSELETEVRVVVEDDALRAHLEALLAENADALSDDFAVRVAAEASGRAPGEVLVRVPRDVFEGAGFSVDGDSLSVEPVRVAVGEWLLHEWADAVLGPTPEVRVAVEVEPEPSDLEEAAEEAGAMANLGTFALMLSLVMGLAHGVQLATDAARGSVRTMVLAAGRRPVLLGLIGGSVAWDLAGRVPGLAVLLALYVWLGASAGVGVAEAVQIAVLTGLCALAMASMLCAVAVSARLVDDLPPAVRTWMQMPVTMVAAGGAMAALMSPSAVAPVPAIGLFGVWALVLEGDPWAAPLVGLQVVWSALLLEAAVRICGREESPFSRFWARFR